MKIVVTRLAQVLAAEPAVIGASAVSARLPESAADMPSVSVVLDLLEDKGRGLGRIVRAGHGVVRNLQSVTVQADPNFASASFDTELSRYKLWPLPIRRNPDAPRGPFGRHDISVINLSSGETYSFERRPASAAEFHLNPDTGVIRFGAPQTAGQQLEIEHWTVAWRDDVRDERYQGELGISVWGRDFAAVDALGDGVVERLQRSPSLLRSVGFSALRGRYLGAASSEVFDPFGGSPFQRWRQELRYCFCFAAELGGEASAGGVIRRIDVNIDDQFPDPFSIAQ